MRRVLVVLVVSSLGACAHSRDLPRVRADVPVVGTDRPTSDNQEWNHARERLESLSQACEVRRTRMEEESDDAERTLRITSAAIVGVLEGVEIAGGRTSGSDVLLGTSRCDPATGPSTLVGPGQPGRSVGCSSTATGGGPIQDRASRTRGDSEARVADIHDAYEWLGAHREAPEWSDEDADEWHRLQARIEAVCAP